MDEEDNFDNIWIMKRTISGDSAKVLEEDAMIAPNRTCSHPFPICSYLQQLGIKTNFNGWNTCQETTLRCYGNAENQRNYVRILEFLRGVIHIIERLCLRIAIVRFLLRMCFAILAALEVTPHIVLVTLHTYITIWGSFIGMQMKIYTYTTEIR